MDTPNVPTLRSIPLRSIDKCKLRTNLDSKEFSEEEYAIERQIYNSKNLNPGQRLIFDYMHRNPTNLILIQAGPGTGKTFTLMSIAHAWQDPVNVIIYKHDLLYTFRYNAVRLTVAKFIMQLLNLQFFEYKSMEQQLSGKLNALEFITCIVSLLRRAKMLDFRQSLVILDEYTVVPKPLLFLTLMLLKHYKIGTIICGDKNQLQNIHNSSHIKCSSFVITKHFVDQIFTLDVNERCADTEYNRAIEYISRFSSEKKMDDFGYAIATALFAKQLLRQTKFSDIHLAATHQELADTAHMMTLNGNHPTSFYYIDGSKTRNAARVKGTLLPDGLFMPDAVSEYVRSKKPNKFLPYLPLVVGSLYFVHKYSEYSQATLANINEDGSLVMRGSSGKTFLVNKNSNHAVMFDQHRDFLLNNGLGNVYNYPIYPANLMSIHKCQGCTVTGNLDLILNRTTYQGFYVSVSRVKTPNQITRVLVPNMISHLVSCIINFPELVTNLPITADILDRRLINYAFYKIEDYRFLALKAINFMTSEDATSKQIIRDEIIHEAIKCKQEILNPPADSESDLNITTINQIIKYKDFILALSCIDDVDSNVWVHEFILCSPEMMILDMNTATRERQATVLVGLAGLNNSYPMSTPSMTYIEGRAKVTVKDLDKQQFVIKEVKQGIVKESSRFCSRVYHMYANNEKITISWLVGELNAILEDHETEKTPATLETPLPRSSSEQNKRSFYTSLEDITSTKQIGNKSEKSRFTLMKRVKKI